MNYHRIANSSIDPNDWSPCATGQRYRGVANSSGQPDGMGIMEMKPGLLYAGEFRQGKRHGRGFVLRLEDRSRDNKYWHRYSYEQVMATAEFDSCGRVISTGPSGEWRTEHIEEYVFVKEQDGQWRDDALIGEMDSSVLAGKEWSAYTLMQRDLLLTSGDYPVEWDSWSSSLSKIETDGKLKINGYAHFVTPYDDSRLLVLDHHGSAPFVVAKGGMTYWDVIDNNDNHTQHFYSLFHTGAENEMIIEDGVLCRCTVRQPHVEIPWGVVEVAPECFLQTDGKGQDSLFSVTIPKTCKKIGRKAFAYSRNLQHALVMGPTDIDDLAFASCPRLRHIELWRGVCRLGHYCLADCEDLPYVYIPLTVVRMGQGVAVQHKPEVNTPVFYCQRQQAARDWDNAWTLAHRNGHDTDCAQPDIFHRVVFGVIPTKGSQHFLPPSLSRQATPPKAD